MNCNNMSCQGAPVKEKHPPRAPEKHKSKSKTKNKPHEHRHKGRIERLRVLLAYGFEARTQHQLSSSRRGDANDGAATKPPTPTPTPPSLTLRAKEHAPHYSTTKAASRHQPKGDMNVVSFHAVIKLFGPQRCCPSCGGGCTHARWWWWGTGGRGTKRARASLRGCCYTRTPWGTGRVTMALVLGGAAAFCQHARGTRTQQQTQAHDLLSVS